MPFDTPVAGTIGFAHASALGSRRSRPRRMREPVDPCPAAADVLPPLDSRVEERQFTRPAGVPQDDVLQGSGAVIGEVRIVRINVFDPAIEAENTPCSGSRTGSTSSRRESTVAAQLLFRSGDRYDAKLVKESERSCAATSTCATRASVRSPTTTASSTSKSYRGHVDAEAGDPVRPLGWQEHLAASASRSRTSSAPAATWP